jgi:hypothetical protein
LVDPRWDGLHDDRVAAPLLTRDARELRLLARPRWQRRVLAWALPVAAAVLTGLHVWAVGPAVCTVRDPCRPDLLGSVAIALLFAAAVSGLVLPGLAVWFASGFVASLVVSERLLRPAIVSPVWLYVVDVGFVGLCTLLSGVDRDRPPTDRAWQWLAGVRREPPPAVNWPTPGRLWRGTGWVLAVPAAACLMWGWYAQQQADARQRVAARVVAEVTAHVDEFTVQVRLPTGTTRIGVLEAANYPVGEPMELYVDDRGLHQPVSEPYDATGWSFLGVFLAAVALTLRARGVAQGHGQRRWLTEQQPVTEVWAMPGLGAVAVYAGDARPGEPAVIEISTMPVVYRDEDPSRLRLTSADLEPGLHPASLYGTPAPGHWCLVAVHGRPVVPLRPLSTRPIAAPPYGHSFGAGVDGTEPPRLADLPLRTEELAALRPSDRQAMPGEVRAHVRSPSVGYVVAAALSLFLVAPRQFLPDLSYGLALLLAGVGLACSCGLSWWLFMRGRVLWNDHGIAALGAVGTRSVDWRRVREIEHDDDSVIIHTGDRRLIIGAGPVFGLFGRRDRGPEELAYALRHARGAALAHDRGSVGPGDLPHLDRPRWPAGLYLLWLFGTPVLAWILQVAG